MKIQNLLFPKVGVCSEQGLFFRKEKGYDREVFFNDEEQILTFNNMGLCTFDTYFNSLSVSKWRKYTTAYDFSLCVKIKGRFEITLFNSILRTRNMFDDCDESAAVRNNIVYRRIIQSDVPEIFEIPYGLNDYQGALTFSLKALKDDSVYYGGWYNAAVDETTLYDVFLAVNICTFKREIYIQKNLDNLMHTVFEKADSDLFGHLRVYVSDNAHTLPIDDINNEYIRIVPNKNVGGAGGFTRGLIEIMRSLEEYHATHAIMMDDDVVIDVEALYRTYAILRCRKPVYEELFIGGAMLSMNDPTIQVESGASWNAGALISNKQGYDLSSFRTCLLNEVEEYVEYNAWWYCCTPMSVVREDNLPLPIFIRGDDLEYGLRNAKSVLVMNGICVWHEAFENKYSSFLSYYILRNLLYDNALHFKNYSRKQFMSLVTDFVAHEVSYFRYKNVDLIFRGVDDFFRGVEFLLNTDGEKLHKEIMASGYKMLPVENIKNVSFHMGSLRQSMEENDSRFHKWIRMLSANGYVLPAKRYSGNAIKVVPMATCRPINFYREKRVLNYDISNGKAFVTERNLGLAIKAGIKLIALSISSVFKFKKAMQEFSDDAGILTNINFWNSYLH